ncbi:hypothetical protein [Fundicoccus culcitae]|uniref:DUF4878 domain-containing protein n=1 Tax=Fundicoccus culcitae TaxID=2969821 RepID=A0ABY5P8H1_9LACT|nr:hypothetical protein [Fundicoccus culcitae]UUX35049.1 hypothetical protein NRE15_05250 [Fundicoccus culcitae]
MKKIFLIILLILLLMLPNLYNIFLVPTTEINGYEVKGNLSNESAIAEVVAVIENNIQATNEENIDLYVSTLVPSARVETQREMQQVFDEFDIRIVLESIEVLEQTNDMVKLRVQQRATSDDETYRDHVATVGITLIYENEEWLIVESMMENTEFI